MPYLKEMSTSAIEKAASENLDLETLKKYL
jgi:hypothetical protein